jgi:hypothetical protein
MTPMTDAPPPVETPEPGLDLDPPDPAEPPLLPESRSIDLPTDDSDAEGYDRLFRALGRPDSAADYGLGELAGADAAFSQQAAEWLFEAGVGKARAGALAEKWNAYVEARSAQDQQDFHAQSRRDWDALKTEWGPAFAANREQFQRGARTFGVTRDEMAAIEAGLGTRRAVSLFARIGQGLGEDRFIEGEGQGGFGLTPQQAESRIASLRRDQAWQARWMAGGSEERAEWTRLTRIAGAA